MGKKVVTGLVRFAYFNAFKPRLNELSGKSEYSTQILIPKTDKATLAAIRAAITEAITDKFNGKRPAGLRNPLKDGDADVAEGAKALGAEYEGHFFLSAKCSEDQAPQIVDAEGQDILSSKEFGSGDYGRVSISAYGYDQKVNKGISFWLNNIQFLEKGEPLSGRSNAADDFAEPLAGVKKKAKPASAPVEDEEEDEEEDETPPPKKKVVAVAKKKAKPAPAEVDDSDEADDNWA